MSVDAVSSIASRATSLVPGGDPRAITRLPASEQVKAAAGQFEAILVRQFLEKSVGNMLGGDSAGPGASQYGYLLTDALSTQLTAGGGLGLSKILERQLSPRASAEASATPEKANP
jgi:flagellar protein FlgJ